VDDPNNMHVPPASSASDVIVGRNDAVSPAELAELNVDGVLISPGPGIPQEAGQSMPLVTACARTGLPLFGVCLGHQAIGAVFGAPIIRAPELLHGKTSEIVHDGTGVLGGAPCTAHWPSTVTLLKGKCGSSQGNITNRSSADTAVTSTSVCSSFQTSPPGR
jgi:anthranilate/para-aminobenzoate synthase component II